MPGHIDVGSAEFKLYASIPEFRKQMLEQAPELANLGSEKIAANLATGAKKGGDALLRETQRINRDMLSAWDRTSKEIGKSAEASFKVFEQAGKTAAPGGKGIIQKLFGVGENQATVLAVAGAVGIATAAIVKYSESVQATIKEQDQLNHLYGEGTVSLKNYTDLNNNLIVLQKSTSELGNALGQSLAPPLTAVTDLLSKGAQAAADFVKSTLPISEQKQLANLNALTEANSPQAKAARQQVADDAKAASDAAQQRSQAEIKSLDQQKEAQSQYAAAVKQQIADVRDAKLKAVENQERAALRAIDAELEASKREYESLRADAEHNRDVQIKAIEDQRDAQLNVLDAEQTARENARRLEDQANERSVTAQRRALDSQQEATLRALDQERDAVEAKTEAALRGIDQERDAEDRRHQEALDNLDREKDARLGAIDAQLRALSDAERAQSRQEESASLQQALKNAQRELSTAKQGDPSAIARARGNPAELKRILDQQKNDVVRAQQAVQKAQDDIAKAARRNRVEDQRQQLQDQKDEINKEIAARKKAEDDQTVETKRGLDNRTQAVKDDQKNQLDDIATRRQNQEKANADELAAFEDHLKQLQDARINARADEDQLAETRKKKIADDAKAEVDSVKAAYDDPKTGYLAALAGQQAAIEKNIADRQLKIQDDARFQQEQIKATADYQTRAMQIATENVTYWLNQQKQRWVDYANFAQQQAARAAGQVNAPQAPAPQHQQPVFATPQPLNPLQQGINALNQLGGGPPIFRNDPLPKLAKGGSINEPTFLLGINSGKIYGLAGEAGEEFIVPKKELRALRKMLKGSSALKGKQKTGKGGAGGLLVVDSQSQAQAVQNAGGPATITWQDLFNNVGDAGAPSDGGGSPTYTWKDFLESGNVAPIDQSSAGAPAWKQFLEGMANGGTIREPTLLVSMRTGRPTGLAGEAGIEDVIPRGRGGGAVINMPVTVDARGAQDPDAVANKIVEKATARLVHLLDTTQQTAGARVPRTIPGAA